MNWHFYRKRLIYASPYWIFIACFTLTIIDTSLGKMHLPYTQLLLILYAFIIPIIFWWLMTPLTFVFLESFRPIKELIRFKSAPSISFEESTPLFVRMTVTALLFTMHHTLELSRYILICGLAITLSFIVSPTVIVVIAVENLLKKLLSGRV